MCSGCFHQVAHTVFLNVGPIGRGILWFRQPLLFNRTLSFLGVDCEELSPVKNEESSLEGNSVTLTYKYSITVTLSDQLYWYRQYPGKPPEFLIFHYGTQNALNHRLFVEAHGEKVQVQISSAAVSDSAVYYCAVRPTVTGNRNLQNASKQN
uniref:Ig-like domain-containing protein n=1 Tax=Sphaeramia orbicularis TaxID=375764 RepID=A0A672YEI1_9TELE